MVRVAGDGVRFLRILPVEPVEQESAITRIELVLNWFAELQRRAVGRATP